MLIRAFAAEIDGRGAELGDDEIGIAGESCVGDGDGAGLGELDCVEVDVFGDVGPGVAEIAEEAEFRPPRSEADSPAAMRSSQPSLS